MSTTTTAKPVVMEARLRVMHNGRCHYTLPVREGMEDAAAERAQSIAARISPDATVEPYVAPKEK
jgi:hypothetical protein